MVQVQRNTSRTGLSKAVSKSVLLILLAVAAVVTVVTVLWLENTATPLLARNELQSMANNLETKILQEASTILAPPKDPQAQAKEPKHFSQSTCPYHSWQDLTEGEQHPVASAERHMVTPPAGGKITLVCCETTVGPWNIAVHHKWAPLGAQRFLDMVEADYFNNQNVPFMRCVDDFLCQFGLAGDASRQFHDSIPDDPNWLPEGPTHRENILGVKRFSRGYMAFAGARNAVNGSRGVQLIVALADNGPLAGGSPWEVPWGELVGAHSFETLSKIYTGYGEKGPKQGMLRNAGALPKVAREFPLLDWIQSCHVIDDVEEEGGIFSETY
jgi:cyclophilin family peptidyl-prolyl cis-trans isomerase